MKDKWNNYRKGEFNLGKGALREWEKEEELQLHMIVFKFNG